MLVDDDLRISVNRLAQRAFEVTNQVRQSEGRASTIQQAGSACTEIYKNLTTLLADPKTEPARLKQALKGEEQRVIEAEAIVAHGGEVVGGSSLSRQPTLEGMPGLFSRVLEQPRLALALVVISVFFTGLLLGAFALGLQVVRSAAPTSDIRVEPSGAITFLASNQRRAAWFLMSPTPGENGPWVDTGIRLNKGERAIFHASGRVNLAMHRMMQVADSDDKPPIPWTGPGGLKQMNSLFKARPRDRYREKYSLAPSLPYGALIGQIAEGTPDLRPAKDELIEIPGESSIDVNKDGKLWLAINEIYFDRTMRDAYIADATGKSADKKAKDWDEKIVGQDYWHIWYDDNAGSFLVTIESYPNKK